MNRPTYEFGGKSWFLDLGSDVNPRDGMYLELIDEQENMLAQVYLDDPTGEFTVLTAKDGAPLGAVEWLIAEAKTRLPPG